MLQRRVPEQLKVTLKSNQVWPYYGKKSVEVQKAIVQQRIRKGNLHRHQKAEKEILHLEHKQAAINALIDAVCLLVSNKQDLDKIYSGPQSSTQVKAGSRNDIKIFAVGKRVSE